jgi:uncharacterized protein
MVGMAYSPAAAQLARLREGLVDYLEIPFEQLRHVPALAAVQEEIPLMLHCASLSMAGFVDPDPALVGAVADEAKRVRAPWISEHLAFITAEPFDGGAGEARPTELTYTLCPQLSEEVLRRVADNLDAVAPRLPVPLILENPPQYFEVPGSTMTMVEFIGALVERTGVALLLDLSHFAITASNMGFDPARELDRLPLETVVEVHMSGHSLQSGVMWDDHATAAPDSSFALLEQLLKRTRPRAITFEYNWGDGFPPALVESHIERARAMLAG